MRAVIQRVKEANCQVEGQMTGKIGTGLLILLGIEENDTYEDLEWLGNKIIKLRIFSDEDGLMNWNLEQIQGDILLISQFTLAAQTKKGNRPSFIRAAKPDTAKPLYNQMIEFLEASTQKQVACGIFGADMQIHLINDGPVTIIMNTKDKDNF